jgi:hypothetical protein
MLLNADVGLKDLKTVNQNIAALIDQTLAVHSLPVECNQCSWRGGSASRQSSDKRGDMLVIHPLKHMLMSLDAEVCAMSRNFIEDEGEYKGISRDPAAQFSDWVHEGFM